MYNMGNKDPHIKHAIQIYLSCALYFKDITEDTFLQLIRYYDTSNRVIPLPKERKHHRPQKIDVDMVEVRTLLDLKVPKKTVARKMGISVKTLYGRLSEPPC